MYISSLHTVHARAYNPTNKLVLRKECDNQENTVKLTDLFQEDSTKTNIRVLFIEFASLPSKFDLVPDSAIK